MSEALPILDAHIHLWDPRTTPRASSLFVKALGRAPRLMEGVARALTPRRAIDFLGSPEYVLDAFLPERLDAMYGAVRDRVVGFVHVEAGWEAKKDPLGAAGETAWLDGLAPAPVGIVGAATLDAPELDALLSAHEAASSRFRGVRDKLAFSDHHGVLDWCDTARRTESAAFRRGYALLGERDLTFDAFVYAPQLGELATLVDAHPETNVVLCHMGTPIALAGPHGGLGRTASERMDIDARWRDDMRRVAASPHVRVKLSGFTMPVVGWAFHERARPPSAAELADRLGPYWRFVVETFGPERCIFGSNFPMDAVSITFGALVEALELALADLPVQARRGIFHDNAAAFYSL